MTTEPGWWKSVLGEYPTGVTLITSLDDDGEPVAMIVGTFSAVSENPPLFGFMPNNDSSTFPSIAKRGRFVANVLGSAHEDLCRAFARKTPDRFTQGEWVTTESGIPRLADAVAWFDGSISETHVAGDHTIVVATVNDFGVGNANVGLPLLFLRGGYGSFTVPSLEFDVDDFGRQLRLADLAREPLRAFADEVSSEIALNALSKDRVVLLHVLNLRAENFVGLRPVGTSFPFAAPVAPSFAAWASDETVKTWIEGARHLAGAVDRPALSALLDATRRRGFAISRGEAVSEDFPRILMDPESKLTDLAKVWEVIARENAGEQSDELPDDVSSLQVPVFDENGHAVFVIALLHMDADLKKFGPDAFVQRLLDLSKTLTAAIGGHMPGDLDLIAR
ncbi:MAG TPA: flavin reductase [Pseudolysinimonas sp.]|nr:flavin reductase [Pseudolysinimonas sp.]